MITISVCYPLSKDTSQQHVYQRKGFQKPLHWSRRCLEWKKKWSEGNGVEKKGWNRRKYWKYYINVNILDVGKNKISQFLPLNDLRSRGGGWTGVVIPGLGLVVTGRMKWFNFWFGIFITIVNIGMALRSSQFLFNQVLHNSLAIPIQSLSVKK